MDALDDAPPPLTGLDAIVDQFPTYEDYLDNQVTNVDMYYLENEEMARSLVELGYRGEGEILRRDEFETRKEQMYVVNRARGNKKPKKLASAGKELSKKPLLKALAQREEAVRVGKLSTLIYVRDFNKKGHEISGYVDYADRLANSNFELVFDKKKPIMPTPKDLSYFNWETMNSTVNDSPNWQVITDDERGILFKNTRDGKIVDVDPKAKPGDNTTRFDVKTDEYHHVVLYDHLTRRRK
mmetsp:Transcript_14393/g.47735  ORF Transcript_14393/g.47735 Transcript_14393/m.47735 type:complete len:240 (-) Transcript_14393:235-954(-)